MKAKLPCLGSLAVVQELCRGYQGTRGAVVGLGKSYLKALQALQMTAWTDLLEGREMDENDVIFG